MSKGLDLEESVSVNGHVRIMPNKTLTLQIYIANIGSGSSDGKKNYRLCTPETSMVLCYVSGREGLPNA